MAIARPDPACGVAIDPTVGPDLPCSGSVAFNGVDMARGGCRGMDIQLSDMTDTPRTRGVEGDERFA